MSLPDGCMRDAQVPELYDRVLSLAPPPPQVPFQMHLVQEPPFSDKGSMGATLCRMAEELEVAAVVGSSSMLRHRGGGWGRQCREAGGCSSGQLLVLRRTIEGGTGGEWRPAGITEGVIYGSQLHTCRCKIGGDEPSDFQW